MNEEKKRRLEAAGWKVGDATEFLGLSPEEVQLVTTQKERADKIDSNQPRVACANQEIGEAVQKVATRRSAL